MLTFYKSMQILQALPASHPFSGGDCTACFNRKGKVKPYEKMVDDDRSLNAFKNWGPQRMCLQMSNPHYSGTTAYCIVLRRTPSKHQMWIRRDSCYSIPSFPRRATSLRRWKRLTQNHSTHARMCRIRRWNAQIWLQTETEMHTRDVCLTGWNSPWMGIRRR